MVAIVGIIHRSILLCCLRPALVHLLSQVPYFQAMQLYPVGIYQKHFWAGLWFLQQTPPIAHIVFRIVLLAGGWPYRTAEMLCALQGIISIAASCLLCSLIRTMTGSTAAALCASLWFLLSTDLVVSEYALFGQMFYEDLGMLFVVLGCWQESRMMSGKAVPSAAAGFRLGAALAGSALTRSSLSFLPIVFGAAGAFVWRRRVLAGFAGSVLLLQGGWAIKNWIVQGRLSLETSSWSGMNLAKGIYWSKQDLLLLDDIRNSPAGRYPDWFRDATQAYIFPFQVSTQAKLPPQLLAADSAMVAQLGGIRAPWNLPSVAAESDAWRVAAAHFTLLHPLLSIRRFGEGYRFVWQRIADHAALFPWNLLYVKPVDRDFPGLLSRGFRDAQRVRQTASASTTQPDRKIWLGTISLAPLDALSIVVLHALLPVMAVIDLWRRRRGKNPLLPQGTMSLAVMCLYGLILFSIGEGGENMRFRLSIEPVILALTMSTLWAAIKEGQRKNVLF